MVERVSSNFRNTGDALPVRVRRGGGEGDPDYSRGREAGKENRRTEPDRAEVKKLARELAAEFGREHIVENSRVKLTEPVLIARAVDAPPGNAPANGPERNRGPLVLEAVESAPGPILRQPFPVSDNYHSAPESPASGGAPRGDILNFRA